MRKLGTAVGIATFIATLAGCATSSGVMKISPDTYMISGGAGYGVMSAGRVQADSIREGTQYCEKQGKEFMLAATKSQDTYFGHPATSEIQFLCLSPGDPQLTRRTIMPVAPATVTLTR